MKKVVAGEIDRITPLGLTAEEAQAWYRGHVLTPALRRGSTAAAIASLMLLAMYTPLDAFLEETLAAHMVAQHFLFIPAGFLYAYATALILLVASRISSRGSRVRGVFQRINSAVNKRGVITFAIAALLIAYWYIPTNFDAAVRAVGVHLEMHLSFVMAGALTFIGSTMLTKSMRRIAPVVVGKAMGLYGMFLLLTQLNFYPVYPISQQSDAGVVLLLIMLLIDFTIVPVWLYKYFGKGSMPPTL